MRTAASDVGSRESRGQVRMGTRPAALRKARLRALALESLEARTLLAVLPPIIHDPGAALPINLSTGGANTTTSNESAPTIAVDVANPQHLVSVWTRSDTAITGSTKVIAQGAYSANGGISWSSFNVQPNLLADPQTSNPVTNFAEVTDASAAFDRNGSVYVVTSQHAVNGQTGAVVMERFDFSGGAPGADLLNSNVIYQWDSRNATNPSPAMVLSLSLAVDNTLNSFSDGSWSVSNPNSGNVYVAMARDTPPPSGATNFNRNTVELLYSTDRGATFSAPLTLGAAAANNTNEHDVAPRIAISQGGGSTGITPGLVSVVWDDFGTDAGASPNPLDDIRVRTFDSGTQTLGAVAVAAKTTVRGTLAGGAYPVNYTALAPAVSPNRGIGPAPVIAADNTLGNFSQFEGRLYIAYVGRTATTTTNTTNPTDNTDIFLATSSNGGQTWSSSTLPVNQDNSQVDGYSEAVTGRSGRPQFEPQVAVDPATGTLAVSYLDARDDAARARYATYVTTSIDGGGSFAADTFVNSPQTAFDTISRQTVTLGPIPDNQSGGNGNTEQRYAFGDRQGLAVYNGRLYAAWSGDENGGTNTRNRLDIRVAPMRFAVGPRIVSSTMGLAAPFTASIVPAGVANPINSPDPTTGIPRVNGFLVSFDRYVDPSTFTAADVRVSYLAPGAASAVLKALTNVRVTAQDSNGLGATTFLVTFDPLTAVGTYSYAVGPTINDRVESRTTTPATTTVGHQMDQSANGVANETTDAYATPRPLSGTPFQSSYDTTTLPLIIPGPHVVSTRALDASGQPIAPTNGENLALNKIVTGVQVTFDRDMRPSTFDGSDVLGMVGPIGPIAGPFTVQQVGGSVRTFNILFPVATPQRLSGSYTVTLGPNINSVVNSNPSRTTGDPTDANQNAALDQLRGGNASNGTAPFVASNATVTPIGLGQTIDVPITIGTDFTISAPVTLTLDISFPNDPQLSATLVILDPNGIAANNIRIPLFAGIGAAGNKTNFQNTIFDDNATTPIENGAAPFTSRYRTQTGLGALLSSLNGRSAKATYVLEIANASSTAGDTGQLNSWSISLGQPASQDGLGEAVADQTAVNFRIFVMDPSNVQSQDTWTAVGPASLGSGSGQFSAAGRVGGLAIDPSDPSGNTVFAAGASGGVWKTGNFLTSDANGPTWIPLTDFGPTNAINVGSIALFPQNKDPRQTIIFAATGEGDTGSPGVGFLRSLDGGSTWNLLDSLNNFEADGVTPLPINGASPTSGAIRDHAFVGTTSFKIVVDPRLTPSRNVIVYAALSGANGGIYRSLDTGRTWQLMKAGKATDVVLDPYSGPKDAFGDPVGNLQTVYAAFGNDSVANNGVWMSTNQGQVFTRLDGGLGLPLTQDAEGFFPKPIPVNNNTATPSGRATGRIILAKPELAAATDSNANVKNLLYEGWLYALVAATDNSLDGLYLTKDYGQNWTKVSLTTALPLGGVNPVLAPSNSPNAPSIPVNITGTLAPQGNYDLVMAIDPSNPNVVYIGGKADLDTLAKMIRVDVTNMTDLYSFYLDNDNPDGGLLAGNTTDPVTLKNAATPPLIQRTGIGSPALKTYLNLLKNPTDPLGASSTFYVQNTASFNNSGLDAKWIPFDTFLAGSDDLHRIVTFRDPVTGKTRIIVGDDHGVWTGVDRGDGQLIQSIGSNPVATYSRNGNLQITQLYYGAAQPSSLASQIAGALFYGQAQDDGAPASSSNALTSGNIRWANGSIGGDGSGVATDQTGLGTQYAYKWPGTGGNITDFFQVNGTGRTSGLIQQSGSGQVPDPQWPYLSPAYTAAGIAMGNFAVNPINGDQILISSNVGRVFATNNRGLQWQSVGEPQFLDSTYAPALAFGAPDPSDPTGATNNFLYAGTVGGKVFVTFTGGGSPTTNNWTNITNGDLAGNTAGVLRIIPSPVRGSHEAYAVTTNGVYHIAESNPIANVPAALKTWKRINGPTNAQNKPIAGNIFGPNNHPFNDLNLGTDTLTQFLTSLEVDWRYTIPDAVPVAGDPSPTHPILYVSGNSGVYRSLDDGQSWSLFPSIAGNLEAAPRDGGYLPNVKVMDLDLSIGNVDPTTGAHKFTPGDPGFLLATTYGRGSFAIRLAPIVIPNTAGQPKILTLDPADDTGASNNDGITTVSNPRIDGTTEPSAFGNVVYVSLYDMSNPSSPVLIGGYDPSKPATAIAANQSGIDGRFSIPIRAGYFTTGGPKNIGVKATEAGGTSGNIQQLTFIIGTTPALTLPPGSDTGLPRPPRDTDLITDISLPSFTGTVDPGATVTIFINGTAAGSATADPATGVYTLAVTTALTEGLNSIKILVTDVSGSIGLQSATTLTVRLDTTPPPSITSALDPASDTGTSNSDGVTKINTPTFTGKAEISPYLGATPTPQTDGALVQVSVQLVSALGQPANPIVLAGEALADPTTGAYSVTVGQYVNPQPAGALTSLPDGVYNITTVQYDVAGNASQALQFGNTGAVVIDGTDSALHGDSNGPGGTNEQSWLYMQKVFNAIEPNITKSTKTFVVLGAQPNGFLSQPANSSAFAQSNLPKKGWNIIFVNGTATSAANIDTYLGGGAAQATDAKGNALGTITLAQTGFLDIVTANKLGDDLNNAALTVLDQHGLDIKNFVNTGGGLYAEHEESFGTGAPAPFGWLQTVFLGLQVVQSGGGTNGLVVTTAGQQIFPTLTANDFSSAIWHNYFTGNFAGLGLSVAVTVPLFSGTQVPLVLASSGGVASTNPSQITIDTTPPATPPAPVLAATSDTGVSSSDDITQDNNSTQFPAPVFNVPNSDNGATLQLYRTPVDSMGLPIAAQRALVNTATNLPAGTASIADINNGQGTIPDGTYIYTAVLTDLAGNSSQMSPGLKVTIVTTIPATPPQPTLASDTGTFNNDDITNANNSATSPAPSNAPIFNVTGVLPSASVALYRNNQLVNQVDLTAGGTVAIADTNNGQGTIPDGTYIYRVKQIDVAGNASALSNGLSVTIDASPPLAAAAPVLEPASDTSNGSLHTSRDNNPSPSNAPVFDVGGVEAGATVILRRAPLVGSTLGTFSQVNSISAAAGGTVAIADTNNGLGTIPDGTYIYQAQQVDLAGNPGPISASSNVITFDTVAPAMPAAPVLDPMSDTGISHTDGITRITLIGFPIIDISGVEGSATVKLYRKPPGGNSSILVGSAFVPGGSTTVSIIDPSSPSDGTYSYTVQELDQAGNMSPFSPPTLVTYDTAQPPTPGAPSLDPGSQTGGGNPPTTSDRTPTFNVNVTVSGAEVNSALSLLRDGVPVVQSLTPAQFNVTSGTVQITDPGPVSDGSHVYQTFLTDLAGNIGAISGGVSVIFAPDAPGTPVLDPSSDSGTQGDNITRVTTNLKFNVSGIAPNSSVILSRAPVVGGVIGTYSQVGTVASAGGGAVAITDPGPILNDGIYAYRAQQVDSANTISKASASVNVQILTKAPVPTSIRLDAASDSGILDNVTNHTANLQFKVTGVSPGSTVILLRDGTPIVQTAPTPLGGTVAVIDAGPLSPATYRYQAEQEDGAGNTSTAGAAVNVTIVTAGTTPGLALDPGSDSGTKGDGITNVDGSAGVFPKFDVTSVVAGATLTLQRNGVTVQTLTNATAGTVGLFDFNGGTSNSPAPLIPDGMYSYTVQQLDNVGNSATSTPLAVTIATGALAPSAPTLDPGSDTAPIGDNITGVRNPVFDVANLPAGATLYLLRNGGLVGTTPPVVGGGTVAIGDPGPLPDGRYTYTAYLTDGAGNVSSISGPLNLLIVTLPPVVTPVAVSATQGVAATGATTATFTTSGLGRTPDSFTATILWGDGTPAQAGVITPDGTTFRVSGDHTYNGPGPFTISTTVNDPASGSNTVNSTATIAPLALPPGSLAGGVAGNVGSNGGTPVTASNTPTFTGTAPAGSVIRLFAQSSDAGSPTQVGQTVAAGDTTWTITSSPLPDGTYTFSVSATAPGGSSSPALTSNLGTLIIDTRGPQITNITFDTKHGVFFVTYQDNVGLNGGDLTNALFYSFGKSLAATQHPVSVTDVTSPGSAPGVREVSLALGKKVKPGKYFLAIDSSHIRDSAGNALDGELRNGLPSGDGSPGGTFQGRFVVKGRSAQGPLPVTATKVVGKKHPKAVTAHAFSALRQAGPSLAVRSSTFGGLGLAKRHPH